MGDRAHSVVGNAGGVGPADPSRVGEKRVETAVAALRGKERKVSSSQLKGGARKKRTYIVEVDVHTAVMREDKVSDSVCPLDRLGVIVKGV